MISEVADTLLKQLKQLKQRCGGAAGVHVGRDDARFHVGRDGA